MWERKFDYDCNYNKFNEETKELDNIWEQKIIQDK